MHLWCCMWDVSLNRVFMVFLLTFSTQQDPHEANSRFPLVMNNLIFLVFSACDVFHQQGISLVCWLNLFKMHCVLFASKCMVESEPSYIPLFTAFWVGERTEHTYIFAMWATAQDAHIGIGESCINNLLDLMHSFQLFCSVCTCKWYTGCTLFLLSCMATRRPYTKYGTNQKKPMYYSPVHTEQNSWKPCIIL